MERVQERFETSQRQACRVIEQPRSTQRYEQRDNSEDREIVKRLQTLSRKYPRYGYRFMTALLKREGMKINRKRVRRLWREAG